MFEELDGVVKRYQDLGEQLGDPGLVLDNRRYQEVAREHAGMHQLVDTYQSYKKAKQDLEDALELSRDADTSLAQMAKDEILQLEEAIKRLTEELKILLIPKDPNDERNIFLEIRAGAGGDEASIFVGDLFRMYCRYAEERRWKVEIMSSNDTGVGGYKEIIVLISGENVYSNLKYEGGVHRVQRVPRTESSGRVHTSTITVAVMPEVDDVEVQIDNKDLRVEVFRSGGPGGQSVNTTDSAVRITHVPTGVVVVCQDEKSQHKNKAKAMKILKARLYEAERKAQEKELSVQRKSMVGTGERSEKIRTYNFPQGRVTDHRIGLTLHKLDFILDGQLDEIIEALRAHFQAEFLRGA